MSICLQNHLLLFNIHKIIPISILATSIYIYFFYEQKGTLPQETKKKLQSPRKYATISIHKFVLHYYVKLAHFRVVLKISYFTHFLVVFCSLGFNHKQRHNHLISTANLYFDTTFN